MTVSVIIAARNAAATIAQTITSLLDQNHHRWEALVVDNGSTDGTSDVATAAAAGDPRITIVRWLEPGVSGARNHGLARATGDWILFLDADDTIGPEHLSDLVTTARRHANADLIYCDWILAGPDGRHGMRRRVDITSDPATALAAGCAFPIHAALTRASVLADVGGFAPDWRICEDWELWQRIAVVGAVFRRSAGAVATYRLSLGSASTDLSGFLAAGLDVIRKGHGHLRATAPGNQADSARAETGLAFWLAGRALGAGQDAAALLAAAMVRYDRTFDAGEAAGGILDGMRQGLCNPDPDWVAFWPTVAPRLMALLTSLEARFALPDYARLVRRQVEQLICAALPAHARVQIGTMQLQSFDAGCAPDAVLLPETVERLAGIVVSAGGEIGRFNLAPVGMVGAEEIASVLADFIAPPETTGAEPDLPASPVMPDADDAAAPPPAARWEEVFLAEDPWAYGNPYETLKYEQTLAAIAPGAQRALELACAEGHFTMRLAGRVGTLTATDISATAVRRARERCKALGNVTFAVLDLLHDPLPPDQDLIVCSEVLYYFEDTDDLALIADRIAAALRPGGQLVMTHAQLTSDADGPRGIGFDWGHRFGARSIGATFGRARDLVLTEEFRSDLYVIHSFRRRDGANTQSAPRIARLPIADGIPEEVIQHVDWAGRAPDALFREAPGVPVLMYHRITDAPAPALGRYATTPGAFRRQMDWLAAKGYSTISVDQLEETIWEGAALPERPVAVTFDDGYHDNLLNAVPVLTDLGQTATVFIPTDHVGGTAAWDRRYGPPAPLMTWDELGTLRAAGLTLASHGRSHRPMTALSSAELADEAAASRDTLFKQLGVKTSCLAYPYGINDEAVKRALLAHGYRLGFTTDDRRWRPGDGVMAVPRVEVPGGISLEDFIARIRAA